MTSDHATKKGGIRYRYYVSCQDKERPKLRKWRVPAGDLERLVGAQVHARRGTVPTAALSRAEVQGGVERIIVEREEVRIRFIGDDMDIVVPAVLVPHGNEKRIDAPGNGLGRPDPALVKLIVRAHQARQAFSIASSMDEAAAGLGLTPRYFAVLLRLSFLAPDIVAAILDGHQPIGLNRQRLARIGNIPLGWREQRAALGFSQT